MQFSSRDLTNQYISLSYQDVVQRYAPVGTSGFFLDGTGNVLFSFRSDAIGSQILTTFDTASWASSSISASYADSTTLATVALISENALTASLADTASYIRGYDVDGSVFLANTASIALYSESASISDNSLGANYALEAAHATNADNALYATDAGNATTAINANTSSLSVLAETASIALNAISASYSISSSHLIPGASMWIVSGSDGIAPAYLETYDYSFSGSEYVPPYREGRMFYDYRHNSYAYYTQDTGFRLHPGKELVVGIYNSYPVTMARLSAVYISGSSEAGQYRPNAHLAIADGTHRRSEVLGVVRSDIPPYSYGYCIVAGIMHRSKMDADCNGNPLYIGAKLWLDNLTPGGLTTISPSNPYEQVFVGYCSEYGPLGSFIVNTGAIPEPPIVYSGLTLIPTITNNNDGTITVSTSSANLFANAEGIGGVRSYPIAQSTLTLYTSSAEEPNATNYLSIDFNGGLPQYTLTQSDLSNNTSIIRVATINARQDGISDYDVDYLQSDTDGLALANKIQNKDINLYGIQRQDGLVIVETGSLGVYLTAGSVWLGATNYSVPEVDSISGNYEFYFFYHSGSNYTFDIVNSGSITNKYWDDGNGLQPLSDSYYNASFIYRLIGTADEFAYIMAEGQWPDLADARANSQPPGDLPSYLTTQGLLCGRIIVQSGSTTFAEIDSAFNTQFLPSTVQIHNSLAGLQGGIGGQYYHLSYDEWRGTGTGSVVRQYQPTMSNPTFLGATPYHIPYWNSYKQLTLTGSVQIYENQYIMINSGSFPEPSNPDALLVKQLNTSSVNTIGAYSVVNNYSQIYNQNFSSEPNASTDIVATNDNGSQDTNYIDVGIASSNYNDSRWPWVKPNDSYVETDGGDMWMATLTDNALRFTFNNTASTNYADKTGFYLSGSFFGTSSYANSSFEAITASAADSITFVPIAAVSASWVSASTKITLADTASISFAINFVPETAYSASWVSASVKITTADTASYVSPAVIGTPAAAISASFASASAIAYSINFVPNTSLTTTQSIFATQSLWSTNSLNANQAVYASSSLIATSASFASQSISASWTLSASYAPISPSISASYATTASYAFIEATYLSASNWTTTLQGAVAIPYFTCSLAPHEIVIMDGMIIAANSNNAGMKWCISSSIGTSKMTSGWILSSIATTATSRLLVSGTNRLTAATHTSANTVGEDLFNIFLINADTQATVALAAASTNNATTTTIFTGSYIRWTRAGFNI
jgi:hypothetical protein